MKTYEATWTLRHVTRRGWPGYPWHNFGRAYDVAIMTGGKLDWKSPLYARVDELGKSTGLTWGHIESLL